MKESGIGNTRFQAETPMPKTTNTHPHGTRHGHGEQTTGGNRLFLASLLGSLGDLAGLVDLLDLLDDTDSNSLSHVTDGETTKRRIVSESLHTHGLGWNHLDDGGITGLDELGRVLNGLASTTINLLKKLRKLAGNVGSVAIKNWSVSSTDLTRMVEDDDLSVEGLGTLWRIILGVTANIATTNLLDGDVLDVEADIVTRKTLNELFVVHFDGLDFSGHTSGSKCDDHTSLDGTGLNTADRYSANTTNLVNILKRKTKGLVGWTGRWVNGINGLEKSLASGLGLGLLLPTLVPRAVGRWLNHVVTVEAGDGDERNVLGVVADLLDEVGCLLDDFVVTIFGPLGGVHLIDGNDELLDTESIGKKSVLASLTILGDTSFEFTSTGSNDENSAISLGRSSDHVLDEITMTRGINDGDIVFGGLELPESNINGDTTLTFGLQLVKDPSVLEGTLAKFGSFLLELLDGTLVNTTALVDQMSSGGGFAGIDVADNDHVDVHLFFTHDDGFWLI